MRISVKEPPYNAQGDGMADDTVAIRAAFRDAAKLTPPDAAPEQCYRVHFPIGIYRFRETVAIGTGSKAGPIKKKEAGEQ